MTQGRGNGDLAEMAAQVQARAAELLAGDGGEKKKELPYDFVKQCLDSNERGDGCLFATLHRGKFVFNTTPKDGEWYVWDDHVWRIDDFRLSMAAVEDVALEYDKAAEQAATLMNDAEDKDDAKMKEEIFKKFRKRVDRLRTENGAKKALYWAPVVLREMACRESDFDKQPWLLPVRNGVVDLRTGVLTAGRPDDMLTRALDIDYDPRADYQPWVEFVEEICGSSEMAGFIKRSFGCGITGHAYEQYIWVFTGPGRNGKGVLFDLIGEVMRPYYHVISRAMLIEQRSEPSPSAASEHLYSLMGKRIVVGAETNKGQRIDAGAVKSLTGDDDIKCRPNFKSEIVFTPSHNLFLHTNHVPIGLTRDFALVQRLLLVDFPLMFVADPEAEARKRPAMALRFRRKDPTLKDKLRACKQGILRWLVEGTREWIEIGLSPPEHVSSAVTKVADDEDYVGRFMRDCLVHFPDDTDLRISTTTMYDAFSWWWSLNIDEGEKRKPAMKTVNASIRERGHVVESVGGRAWLYRHAIEPDIVADVEEFTKNRRRNS